MDLQGRVLLTESFLQNTNSIDMDVSNYELNSGIYILEFNNNFSRIRKQIIVKYSNEPFTAIRPGTSYFEKSSS